MRVDEVVLGVIDSVEHIRFDNLGRPVALARERPRLVIASSVHMVDVDLQIPAERVEVFRLHNDLHAELLQFGDPRPASQQAAGKDLEARLVQIF